MERTQPNIIYYKIVVKFIVNRYRIFGVQVLFEIAIKNNLCLNCNRGRCWFAGAITCN